MTASLGRSSIDVDAGPRGRVTGGVVVADADGRVIEWNAEALRLHGYANIDDARRPVGDFADTFELVTPAGERVAVSDWPLVRLMRGEVVDNEEYFLRRLDLGTERYVNYTGVRVDLPGAARTLYLLTLHDLTEWRRADAARREAERRFQDKLALLRTLVDGITDPLYVKNADGTFRYANDALARLLGRTPDECVGAMTDALLGPTMGPRTAEIDRAVLRAPGPITYEETLDLGAGDARHFLITKLAFKNADGEPAGLVGFARDVTSLKAAERALRFSERHLRDVLDGLPVAVVVLSPDGRVTEANAVARALFASVSAPDPADVAALPWPAARLRAAIANAAAGATLRLPNVTIDATAADGPPRAFDLTLAPMRGRDGAVAHVLCSAIDVTERRAAEQRARDQQAELAHLERVHTMGHMAAGLAHELNQPLGAITNYAAAARFALKSGAPLPPAELDAVFGDVVAEAGRAGEIIRRLRAFVGKRRRQRQPTQVAALIGDAIRMMAFELRSAGIEPAVRCPPGLPLVTADAVQVGQVLVNLMRNALDAMAGVEVDRRRLEVDAVAERGLKVRIDVRDAGPAVDADQVARMFDAFYTTKPTGMGMGLALSRTIVEDHGGHISAAPAPGGGLVVSFTLRVAGPASERT